MSILKIERPGLEARDHRLQRRQGAEKEKQDSQQDPMKGLVLEPRPQLRNPNFAMLVAFCGLSTRPGQSQPLQQQRRWRPGCLSSSGGTISRRPLLKSKGLLRRGLQISLTAVSSSTFLLINLSDWLAP